MNGSLKLGFAVSFSLESQEYENPEMANMVAGITGYRWVHAVYPLQNGPLAFLCFVPLPFYSPCPNFLCLCISPGIQLSALQPCLGLQMQEVMFGTRRRLFMAIGFSLDRSYTSIDNPLVLGMRLVLQPKLEETIMIYIRFKSQNCLYKGLLTLTIKYRKPYYVKIAILIILGEIEIIITKQMSFRSLVLRPYIIATDTPQLLDNIRGNIMSSTTAVTALEMCHSKLRPISPFNLSTQSSSKDLMSTPNFFKAYTT